MSNTVNGSQVVIAIHGVETVGQWMNDINSELTGIDDFFYEPHNYGRVRFVRVVDPWFRNSKINDFVKMYEQVCTRHPQAIPSVIAHSFGTYIISQALHRYPTIQIDKVILCGSVITPDFDWKRLAEQNRVQRIRNEIAKNDHVVKSVKKLRIKSCVPGIGPSGIDGFANTFPQLDEPAFDFTHSAHFVTRLHCREFWIPFIRGTEELVRICKGCLKGDSAAQDEFDTKYQAKIEKCVKMLLHSRKQDYCRLVRYGVLEEGIAGRKNIDQLILGQTLALVKALGYS